MDERISLLPDYTKVYVWKNLVSNMIKGHSKHYIKDSNKAIKEDLPILNFYKNIGKFAEDQEKFWQSIRELAKYEEKIIIEGRETDE